MNSEDNIEISLSGVGREFDGRTVLTDVNLDIRKGDFTVITGPNGGGKTTLLKLILGLLKPTTGSIRRSADAARPGYLPQKNTIDSHFPITAREVVATALLDSRMSRAEADEAIEKAMKMLGIETFGDKAIGTLSGGQLQRTLMARALVGRPRLLVLDEPFSYLDKASEARAVQILESLAGKTTVVMVTHSPATVAHLATRELYVDHTIR